MQSLCLLLNRSKTFCCFSSHCLRSLIWISCQLLSPAIFAQLPECDDSLVYLVNDPGSPGNSYPATLYNYNPAQPLSATNPIANTIQLPNINGYQAAALAVSSNLNNPAMPSPTFYTTVNHIFYYYNGTNWVSTGHSDGGGVSPSWYAGGGLTGSGPYIYIVFNDGEIFRYDGSGDAIFITTIPDWFGPSMSMHGSLDLTGDCEGNFYAIRTEPDSAWLRKYSPSGALLQQWGLVGTYNTGIGGIGGVNSFAMIGNKIYYDRSDALYTGTIGTTNVVCNPVSSSFPDATLDFASCAGNNRQPLTQTIVKCDTNAPVIITASGAAPFQSTVIGGMATVTGTGPSFTVQAFPTATVVLTSTSNSWCQPIIHDTFLIVQPPFINAGPDHAIRSCRPFIDTLRGTVSNSAPGIGYGYSWAPASGILSGANTTNPVINPVAATTYYFTITLPPEQGNCTFIDSVKVTVEETSFEVRLNLEGDQGICPGQELALKATPDIADASYQWFRDGAALAGATGPALSVNEAGTYRLYASKGSCSDTSEEVLARLYPLPEAKIIGPGINPCMFDTAIFSAQVTASKYLWEPADIFYLDQGLSNRTVKGIIRRPSSMVYLTVTNEFGCEHVDSVLVNTKTCCTVFIPNAFSPNSDGRNDYFKPELGPGQALIVFQVYDRWGNQVYNNMDISKGWNGRYPDGSNAEEGTYMYYIAYSCPDGKQYTRKESVSLLR